MRRRNRSVPLLVLPSAVLVVAGWLAATVVLGVGALGRSRSDDARATVLETGAVVVTELQRERQLTAASPVAVPRPLAGAATTLGDQQARTDAAVAAFPRRSALAGLAEVRGAGRGAGTVDGYTELIDAVFRTFPDHLDDPEATRLLRASLAVAAAREQLAREATVLSLGRFTVAEQARLTRAAGARRQLLAGAGLGSAVELISLETLENRLATVVTDVPEWTPVLAAADRRMLAAQAALDAAAADRAGTLRAQAGRWFWLTAVLGLPVVAAAVAPVGRALVRRPRAAGPGEPPPRPGGVPAGPRPDEVFRTIAGRSQTLLHRQLQVLDRMERRTTDPRELEDLFRVDHLATRIRRHAEDLAIVAGAEPGRGWREPVPLIDVVRGAVSEVEEYTRVDLLAVADASLAGRAVTDLTHLLAELIENATRFSPPHTRVTVGGQLVANGFAAEVEDRGLGLGDDEIAEANARLRRPPMPEPDPAGGSRIGLFVVALLAARLGAQVTLRQSPFGGITAVVLVPPDLIEAGAGAAVGAAVGAVPTLPPASAAEDQGRSASGPEPPHELRDPPAAETPTGAPSGDAEPSESPSESPSEPAAVTDDGLPRRVRKKASDPAPDGPREPLPQRPPEETRAMMSAFQSAAARGRRDAQAPADEPEQETT